MADPTMSNGHEGLDEILARLSKKPGVKATIALDRNSGALLRTSGQVSSIRTARTNIATGLPSPSGASFSAEANDTPPRETQGVEELSALVWNFIKAAGTLVEEIDTEDELKFLRLRTKKQELLIVPDSKFLFITVRDTPPA